MSDTRLLDIVHAEMKDRNFILETHHIDKWTAVCGKGETEVTLHSTEKSFSLTAYRQLSEDKVGKSTISFLPTESETAIKKLIDEAWSGAALSSQPAFELVQPGSDYPKVILDDKKAREDPQASVKEVVERAMAAVSSCSHLSLPSLEVTLALSRSELQNSTGLQLTSASSQWIVYQIFLTERAEGPYDQRLEMKRRLQSTLDLEGLAKACDKAEEGPRNSALPPSGKVTLVLPGIYLPRFFSPLVHHACAETQYRNMSRFKEGAEIGADLDWLNLSLDATLDGGFSSYRFDEQGVPGQMVPIIEKGRFVKPWCKQELAKLLNCPSTGSPGNLYLKPPATKKSTKALIEEFPTLLRVDEFSCLNVSPLSGHFSGEIRTGRLWQQGKLKRIRGGAVSGNVFRLLPDTHCCGEETFYGDFLGPSSLIVENVSIAGQ